MVGTKIKTYRKKQKITQEDLADRLSVSVKTVQNWERNIFNPTDDKLEQIAKVLGVQVSFLRSSENYEIKTQLFDVTHMESFVSEKMEALGYVESINALNFVKKTRKVDKRKNSNVPYIYHPLLMVCQAFAMNIDNDKLIACCLLHDAVEHGEGFSAFSEAGISYEVFKICEKMVRPKGERFENYFNCIMEDPMTCMVKCLSRCSNLSSLNTITNKAHLKQTLGETEKYYGRLLNVIKHEPEWNNAAWLLSYQINSLCEAHKSLI